MHEGFWVQQTYKGEFADCISDYCPREFGCHEWIYAIGNYVP